MISATTTTMRPLDATITIFVLLLNADHHF